MTQFRALLPACAQKVQIVVLTCRPEDYVGAKQMPSAASTSMDDPGGAFRVVALERALVRMD